MSAFEQDRVLVRLQQRVIGDREIAACFLSGSYGKRREDGFSDLDVALVFSTDAGRDLAWDKRKTFVQSVLPYVPSRSFDALHVRPYLHIALYRNGAKVDYRYESQESLTATAWDRDIRVLKDRDGWLKQFQAAAAQAILPQPQISPAELRALDDRFWVMLMDVFRLLRRGDWQKPFTIYLELLHFTLPPLLQALPPEDPAYEHLLSASYGRDPQATRRHLVNLLEAYVAARTAVIHRQRLDFPVDAPFENGIISLVKRKA
ncbi:MAG: aminoglycoside 6-adenylyltransferase [Anaerolineae bacterium]